MEWVETTAKTVDQAKELALDQLHVDESDAEFEIVEEPKPGLFGRMRGEARVRARVRPVQPRPKVDRRERRKSPKRGRGAPARGSSGSRPARDADTIDSTGSEEAEPAEASDASDQAAEHPDQQDEPRRSRSRNRRPASTPPASNEEPTVSDDVTVHEQAEIIQQFVEGLVDAFGYDEVAVETEQIDDDTVEVKVDGADLGLLVGPRGNTLQAIHELSRTVVQRTATGHHEGRVRLDVAGYRQRRREALERFTHKLADQAKATGTAQVLEPMAAPDRKVVHDTVNDIDGVHTVSEGEDARRHVVIVPDEG